MDNENEQYIGIVCDQSNTVVFEGRYRNINFALKELRKKARETAKNSFDEWLDVCVTLFHRDKIVATGEVSAYRARVRRYPDVIRTIRRLSLVGEIIC